MVMMGNPERYMQLVAAWGTDGDGYRLPEEATRAFKVFGEEETEAATGTATAFDNWITGNTTLRGEMANTVGEIAKLTEARSQASQDLLKALFSKDGNRGKAIIAAARDLISSSRELTTARKTQQEQEKKAEEQKSFDFMQSRDGVEKEDGTISLARYLEEGNKFATSLMNGMETDGQDGISLEEYRANELRLAGMDADNVSADAETQIANGFEMFDLNNDGILTADEISSVYAIIDTKDNDEGRPDGRIDFDTFGAIFSSPEVMQAVKADAQGFQEMANQRTAA